MTTDTLTVSDFADIVGVSKATLLKWEQAGRFVPRVDGAGGKYFLIKELMGVPQIKEMACSSWDEEMETRPLRPYKSIELFAGAGGLAIGMEMAGFSHVMLNDSDRDSCATLRLNRPVWDVRENDIRNIDFTRYKDRIDLMTGGFPCQAFSYAGSKGGFGDARGTLFFEFARAVREVRPKVFLCENVRGLASHDKGNTLRVIRDVIARLGYTLTEPRIMKAVKYKVPQKRERLIMVATRNDLTAKAAFRWPSPYRRIMTLRDAFFKGELYGTDVPASEGQRYSERKRQVLELVPAGGCWRDLPESLQREYMGGSYLLAGGKTGMARRLSLDQPSLTLTCAPAQKQTERCHPAETRPLTVREYARIQTFPDSWAFAGNLASQYRQIGNAVPVNLAYAIGRSLVRLLNGMESL